MAALPMKLEPCTVMKATSTLWLALLCAACLARAAQPPPTNRVPAEVVIPKSVFVTNDVSGRDPFFPNSERVKQTIQPDPTQGAKPPKPVGVGSLRLLGITTDADGKRIALINNTTFAKGEVHEVRTDSGRAKVRCVEMRETSVVVAFEGQSEEYELVLPEKLLPSGPAPARE